MTPKQERFVKEYLIDLNATQAAIRAGYSQKTANEQGARLLANVSVQEAIQAARAKVARKLEVTAEKVIGEIARVAFSDMRAYTTWGPDGVKLIDCQELTEDQAACIAEVSQSVTESGGSLRFKLHDKIGALTQLAKHLGLIVNEVKHTGTVHVEVKETLVHTRADAKQLLPALSQTGGVPRLNGAV